MSQGKSKNKITGFTMTEVLVSLSLVAVLLLFLIFILRANRPQALLDEAKTKLIEQNAQLVERIRIDLDAAVKNWGATATTLPGITRYPDSARDQIANPQGADGLEIIAERFSELSAPIGSTTPSQFQTRVIPDDVRSYFANVFSNKRYLILSNIEQTTIAKREGTSTENGGKFTVPVNALFFNQSDFENRVSSIRAAEKIRYVFDQAKSQLIRIVPNESGGESESTILAENVALFQVDYGYHDRRTGADHPKLPHTTQRLTHPQDPLYYNCVQEGNPDIVCCNPATETCVDAQDIKNVRVILHLKTPIASRAQSLASYDSTVFIENGELIYRGETYIYPRRYGSIGGTSEITGEALQCPVNDVYSRCKRECNSTFNYDPRPLPDGSPSPYPPLTGDMPYPPNWVGYRLYLSDEDEAAGIPSPYCQCGNIKPGSVDVEDFQPPELLNFNSVPPLKRFVNQPASQEDAESNARLDQCLYHFKGCVPTAGQTFWSDRHPISYLACHCVQGVSNNWIVRDANFPYGWTRPFLTDTGATGLKYSLDNVIPNDNHRLECWQWPLCDYMAGWLYKGPSGRNNWEVGATPESGGGAENYNDWFERCVCDPFQVNSLGQVTTYKTHRMNTRWDYICNLDYRRNLGEASPKCANTVVEDAGSLENRKLKLKYSGAQSDPDDILAKQGLAIDDATVCECLRAAGYSGAQAKSNAGAFDFRDYGDSADPGTDPDLYLPFPLDQLHPSSPNYSTLPPADADPLTLPNFPIPPLVPGGSNDATPRFAFGATTSGAVSFNAVQWDGTTWNDTQLVKSCNKEYCPIRHSWGLSIGCCTDPLHDQNANGIEDWLSPTVLSLVLPQYQPWVNYCAEHCSNWTSRVVKVRNPSDNSIRQVREVDLVREIITGKGYDYSDGSYDAVPPACGSYTVYGGSL